MVEFPRVDGAMRWAGVTGSVTRAAAALGERGIASRIKLLRATEAARREGVLGSVARVAEETRPASAWVALGMGEGATNAESPRAEGAVWREGVVGSATPVASPEVGPYSTRLVLTTVRVKVLVVSYVTTRPKIR